MATIVLPTWGQPMEVSLEEAIEIHARVLRSWHNGAASEIARDHAVLLSRNGDQDGHDVWLRVAEITEQLRSDEERLTSEGATRR